MARVKGILQVTGSLKGVSVYTRRGSEELIMRTKGGPSKNTIKNSPSCKGLRDSGTEWGGCTKAASSIRLAMEPLMKLADYNATGGLNAVCKKIQTQDLLNEKGRRSVLLTEHQSFLAEFNFNKTSPFDSVIRFRPQWEVFRDRVGARVILPPFTPSEQLNAPNKLPFLRFVLVLGLCNNVIYEESAKAYKQQNDLILGYRKDFYTAWSPVKRFLPEQIIEFAMEDVAPFVTEHNLLVLGIGVEFGTVGADGEGEAVKYAGCAKVLGSR